MDVALGRAPVTGTLCLFFPMHLSSPSRSRSSFFSLLASLSLSLSLSLSVSLCLSLSLSVSVCLPVSLSLF